MCDFILSRALWLQVMALVKISRADFTCKDMGVSRIQDRESRLQESLSLDITTSGVVSNLFTVKLSKILEYYSK
jgi:hypothetical protein